MPWMLFKEIITVKKKKKKSKLVSQGLKELAKLECVSLSDSPSGDSFYLTYP